MQSVVHCSSWYPMIFFFGHNSGKARNWYLADLCSVATVLGKDAVHCSSCYMSELCLVATILENRSVHCFSWYLTGLCSLTILEKHAAGIWRF